MPQLLRMNLPERVGPKIRKFGTFLLQDNEGCKMDNISRNCQGRPEDMAMEVLGRWLAGKGKEVSWDSLIFVLRESKLAHLAKEIENCI